MFDSESGHHFFRACPLGDEILNGQDKVPDPSSCRMRQSRSAPEGLGIKNPEDVGRILRISHIPTISVTGIYLLSAALSTICKGKPAIFPV